MGWLFFIIPVYFLCLLVERSLIGISPHDLDMLRSEDSPAARRVSSMSTEIRPTLAALLLARILLITLASVHASIFFGSQPLSDWLFAASGADKLRYQLLCWGLGAASALGLALLFWGLHKLDFQKGKHSAPLLKRLWWFAFFWKALFKFLTRNEQSAKAGKPENAQNAHSADTVRTTSEKREMELLKSIVQFGDVTVKQVMQPRSKVVSVDFRTGFQRLLEVVRQSEFSRLPVYDEDLDNITGILYVKDLVPHLDKGAAFEWQPLIRTNVLMVPEAKRGTELLQEFKQQRMHMAVVVDEYGGIAGIVTMEDILEEVTGDIRDEFDEESEIRYRKIDDFTYLFDGQTFLNDVCRIAGLATGTFDAVRGNSDTLAGLALELRGDIPLVGTELSWNGFLLSVTHANKRRIEQLKLSLPRQDL